jgi:colicin import membrane protein
MIETARQYMLPLLFALLLHALAVTALRVGWQPDSTKVREIKPQIVMSKLIVMEPKPAPKARPKPAAPKPAASRPAPAKPKPVPEPKPKPVEAKPDPRAEEAARLAAQQERDREAAERAASLAALSNRAFEDALISEDQELAANAGEADNAAAQTYRAGIYQRIVDNWSRPPSARNGMEVELQVELVPTGDVVAVTVLRGSGNLAFDQSAESAVRKARRFEVPKESRLFEQRFRRFILLFRPEDLLR